MTRDPIMIPCEGSGQPGHNMLDGWRMCKMCGVTFWGYDDDEVPDHDRRDILAMIDRGDFGK